MFSNRLWSETVFIVLLLLILDAISSEGGTPWRWALAGLMFGLAALTRPLIVTLFPPLALWALLQARRDRKAWRLWVIRYATLAGACALVILPWTARNARATGAFVLIDTNGPFNFLVGTQPEAAFVDKDDVWSGRFGLVEGEPYERAANRDPAHTQAIAMATARQNIEADPGRFVRKSLWEAGHLWSLDSFLLRHLRNGWYGNVPRWAIAIATVASTGFFIILVVAGFAGLAASPPGSYRGLALLLLASFTALFGLTYSLSRYALPMHALLTVPAAAAILAPSPTLAALTRGAARHRRVAFWAALLALALVWLGNLPKLADMVAHGGAHYQFHRIR